MIWRTILTEIQSSNTGITIDVKKKMLSSNEMAEDYLHQTMFIFIDA
jgi:hypothetical protein